MCISTLDLQGKPLRVVYLKELTNEVYDVSEYNGINMNVVLWGRRGKKIQVKIPSCGRLRYERFK